jgi:hemin uptake protein HemP
MNDPSSPDKQEAKPTTHEQANSPKVISTQQLFAGEREICIEHEGECYLLRITRRGKLILQK